MVVNYDQYARSVVFSYSREVSGALTAKWSRILNYIHLTEVNEALAKQNADLLKQVKISRIYHDTTSTTIRDTIYSQRYTYSNATVISNSVNRRNNLIMLDKGSAQGLSKDMGVIGPQGAVGIVVAVSENFSLVMSLLHEAAVLSVKHKKTDQLGSMVWEGKSFRYASLKNLPVHVPLKVGDTIVTSGFSSIFPKGIPVGIVESFKPDQGDYYSVKIRLTTDFNALVQVFVIRDLMKDEQEKLVDEGQKSISVPQQ